MPHKTQRTLGFKSATHGPGYLAYPQSRNAAFQVPSAQGIPAASTPTPPRKQRKRGGGKGGGKPKTVWLNNMMQKYNGKRRCDVLKRCGGDDYIIKLQLEPAEKKCTSQKIPRCVDSKACTCKCRSKCTVCGGAFNNEGFIGLFCF